MMGSANMNTLMLTMIPIDVASHKPTEACRDTPCLLPATAAAATLGVVMNDRNVNMNVQNPTAKLPKLTAPNC